MLRDEFAVGRTWRRAPRARRALGLLLIAALPLAAPAADYDEHPEAAAFIQSMAREHDYSEATLKDWFGQAEVLDQVLKNIARPAEALPWHRYRPIFVTDQRAKAGAAFWKAHADTLARAEAEYGVPPEIVLAILGVETYYGRHTGSHRILDALATLAFDYPPRAKFFRSELEHYLLLVREEGFDPLTLKGSYAGAMGYPQFISSSYRHYAVDFDGDGTRDLLHNPVDAIGSVAAYLARHGWRAGEPVVAPARLTQADAAGQADGRAKPSRPLSDWTGTGVQPRDDGYDPALAATLVELEEADGNAYWLGFNNFYAITRYNHSPLYAMAVYELSRRILEARTDADRA